jgi:hypothetical protein
MPMLEGTIQIDPVTGNIVVKTGAAGEVFDALESGQDYGDLAVTNPPAYANARNQIANMAKAVAKIIPHIQTNAVVSTTVAVGIGVSVDPNTGIGATNSTGAGSGSVA